MRFTLFNLETYVGILVENLYNFPALNEHFCILLRRYSIPFYIIWHCMSSFMCSSTNLIRQDKQWEKYTLYRFLIEFRADKRFRSAVIQSTIICIVHTYISAPYHQWNNRNYYIVCAEHRKNPFLKLLSKSIKEMWWDLIFDWGDIAWRYHSKFLEKTYCQHSMSFYQILSEDKRKVVSAYYIANIL